MYKKFVSVLYLINIVSQAIFTLLFPIGIGALLSYLLTTHLGTQPWIWAILITLGVISGFYSMVKFIITATASLEKLEKEQNKEKKNDKMGNNNEKE